MFIFARVAVLGCLLACSTAAFSQGKIVVNHDEWTLTDVGFTIAPDAAQFVRNVANWFTHGQPGNFLAYSNNRGFNESILATTMQNAGHTWTVSIDTPPTLAYLSNFNAVFLGGYYDNIGIADLIQYVQNGGNVYLAAGTGNFGAEFEANTWNPFLLAFGLRYSISYNGVEGSLNIAHPHPIFHGVSELYFNNGNSVVDLELGNPRNQVLYFLDVDGLIAVYDPGLQGDVDGSGCVDDLDLLPILFAFGNNCDGCPEDLNNDGTINDDDLLIVLFNFGLGC